MGEKISLDALRARTIAVLKKCQKSGDTEAAHGIADKAITGMLESMGFEDVVKEWDKVPKWYA